MSRRRRAPRLWLLLAGLAVALLLAEAIVRFVRPPESGSSHRFRVPHPVLGWVLEPGASYLNQMGDGNTIVTYNSRGWRDREHDLEKPPGRFRIVVLGDSFMEGYSVELRESFQREFETICGWIRDDDAQAFRKMMQAGRKWIVGDDTD